VLVPLLDEIGVPAWFSYSVADGATRAGQPIEFSVAGLGEVVHPAPVRDPVAHQAFLATQRAADRGEDEHPVQRPGVPEKIRFRL
jgi:hypothetical protein